MLTDLFTDPVQTIINFLLMLPALVLALCCHEAAHGLVALWCGDPTAKWQGRLTINPMRHLDPMGFLCLMLFHFGWAKPVPVNPNNFRHPRRDDFFVSVAGIAANLLLCALGFAVMCVPVTIFLRGEGMSGFDCTGLYQVAYGFGGLLGERFGDTAYYLFEMLVNVCVINLSLALFNLLPIPPLDGYHVLNDLILHGDSPFASYRAQRIGMAILMLILFVPQLSNLYSSGLNFVFQKVFAGMGFVAYQLVRLVGLL